MHDALRGNNGLSGDGHASLTVQLSTEWRAAPAGCFRRRAGWERDLTPAGERNTWSCGRKHGDRAGNSIRQMDQHLLIVILDVIQ